MRHRIRIPDGLDFDELGLRRDAGTGLLSFSPGPLQTLCLVNNLDPFEVLPDEDKSMNLICRWYLAHLFFGGAQDEVLQTVLDEMGLTSWITDTGEAGSRVRGLPKSPPPVRTTARLKKRARAGTRRA